MSVRIMAAVYAAHFPDITFVQDRQKKTGEIVPKSYTVLAPTAKSITLALADHANDEGEGAYPSVDHIAAKTEYSAVSVIAALKALKHAGIISYAGISKRGTSNYTVNKAKLDEMATWPRHTRLKSWGKATLPLENDEGKAALPLPIKPLYPEGKAALPESSLTIPNHPLGAQSAPARTQAKKQGDLMDGFLHFAALGDDPTTALKARVLEYPDDVQDTLQALAEIYRWPAAAIPNRPGNGKGGAYAQWINEVRNINNIISGYGRAALVASAGPCKDLSISHPGAITWCLAGEIGRMSRKRESFNAASAPNFLETFKPRTSTQKPDFSKGLHQ